MDCFSSDGFTYEQRPVEAPRRMLQAEGETMVGTRFIFQENSASALEARADKLGLIAYRYLVDGGCMKLHKIGADWVAM